MPIFNFSNEIDVKKFINQCDSDEIHELIQYLFEKGDLMKVINNQDVIINENIKKTDEEVEYEKSLNKLHGKWKMLSKLDTSIIIELSKKF
jgi:hypothetical protein